MIKYYCDKCRKEIDSYRAFTIVVQEPEIHSYADMALFDSYGYQLCDICMKDFSSFFKTKSKEGK